MSQSHALKLVANTGARFVNFRFCDTRSKEQNITMPSHVVE